MATKLTRAILLASIAACGIEDETSTETSALYGVGTLPRWGNTDGAVIPVCWVNPDDHMDLQIRVREIVRETWESYANISFIGPEPSLPFGGLWPPCSETTGRKVAVQFSEPPNNRGNASPFNSDGTVLTLISDRALTDNYAEFRYQVIHEFGHALGFAHEQQRPDNWNGDSATQCGVATNHDDYGNYAPVAGGINLTELYDVSSVMNYCYPAGFPQDLSLGDIRGVRAAYGHRDVKGGIYRIDTDNQLRWFRHDGRTDGNGAFAYGSGETVGLSWAFKDLFAAGGSKGILYTVDFNNQLQWWRHDGRVDGGFRWAPGSGNVVRHKWNFTKTFGAGNGVLYGIAPYIPAQMATGVGPGQGPKPASGGELKWHRHDGQEDGSAGYRWAPGSGSVVGTGWHGFTKVFSGGEDIIYAVTPYVPAHRTTYGGPLIPASGGDLKWYRHIGQVDGSFSWAEGSGNVVGYRWDTLKEIFSGGDGVIYGINSNDQLVWYRHTGRENGARTWAAGSGIAIGFGWIIKDVVGDD